MWDDILSGDYEHWNEQLPRFLVLLRGETLNYRSGAVAKEFLKTVF